MPEGGFDKACFPGGWYLTYQYRDGDDAERARLHEAALKHILDSPVVELDECPGRFMMGHIITPAALIKAQGYAVMETFIPVRLRASHLV